MPVPESTPPPRPIPDLARAAKYATEDWHLIDYHYERLPGTPRWVRGPLPGADAFAAGRYIAYLGSAHTFGRLVNKPFPALLEGSTGLPALNLGYGGARPGFYTASEGTLHHITRSRAVVVQVMSARGAPNSILLPEGPSSAVMRRSDEPDGEPAFANFAWRRLLREESEPRLRELVAESREAWMSEIRGLLAAIPAPVVVFWFSRRSPDWTPVFDGLHEMIGGYPHFVDRGMVEAVLRPRDHYVECVTAPGSVEYRDRFDGSLVELEGSTGTYYPDAGEHRAASASLEPILRRIVA